MGINEGGYPPRPHLPRVSPDCGACMPGMRNNKSEARFFPDTVLKLKNFFSNYTKTTKFRVFNYQLWLTRLRQRNQKILRQEREWSYFYHPFLLPSLLFNFQSASDLTLKHLSTTWSAYMQDVQPLLWSAWRKCRTTRGERERGSGYRGASWNAEGTGHSSLGMKRVQTLWQPVQLPHEYHSAVYTSNPWLIPGSTPPARARKISRTRSTKFFFLFLSLFLTFRRREEEVQLSKRILFLTEIGFDRREFLWVQRLV